eukprot:m.253701 g.253701  ORF g.253701 m.253701 type:complete len:359 (+) comp16162_c0_seq9:142-1218(+)
MANQHFEADALGLGLLGSTNTDEEEDEFEDDYKVLSAVSASKRRRQNTIPARCYTCSSAIAFTAIVVALCTAAAALFLAMQVSNRDDPRVAELEARILKLEKDIVALHPEVVENLESNVTAHDKEIHDLEGSNKNHEEEINTLAADVGNLLSTITSTRVTYTETTSTYFTPTINHHASYKFGIQSPSNCFTLTNQDLTATYSCNFSDGYSHPTDSVLAIPGYSGKLETGWRLSLDKYNITTSWLFIGVLGTDKLTSKSVLDDYTCYGWGEEEYVVHKGNADGQWRDEDGWTEEPWDEGDIVDVRADVANQRFSILNPRRSNKTYFLPMNSLDNETRIEGVTWYNYLQVKLSQKSNKYR